MSQVILNSLRSDMFRISASLIEGGFKILFPNEVKCVDIVVLDKNGETILELKDKNVLESSFDIDLQMHPKGIYYVEISTLHGCFIKKIIKQ